MDFLQKGPHQNQTVGNTVPSGQVGHSKRRRGSNVLSYITGLLLMSVTILIILVIVSVATNAPKHESKFIDTKSMQAVFLNNGQVYFGNISTLNDKYVELQNIYYLRVNQTVQPNQTTTKTSTNSNDVSLVKLGCELHGPDDQMLINREQMTFWENMKTDGQVAKAVAQFVKANPKGQTCTTNTTTKNTSQ